MTDEEDKAVERGRMLEAQEGLKKRVTRLEGGFLGVVAAIVAAWAKSKDLW